MAHTASNSNHSPVSRMDLQALESFSPFHFIVLPTLSPHRASGPAGPTNHTSGPFECPGQRLPRSFLFASVMNKHSRLTTQTYTGVLWHTQTGFSFYFFFQFVVSFSLLQKMQTKEKQGFQLKVHLFFNMKTLIELVRSPMQWSAKSFGN